MTNDFWTFFLHSLFWPYLLARRAADWVFCKLEKQKKPIHVNPKTDNFAPYFEIPLDPQTMPTTEFTGFPTEFAKQVGAIYSGASGSTGFGFGWGATGQVKSGPTLPEPEPPKPKPRPQRDLNLENERAINLDYD